MLSLVFLKTQVYNTVDNFHKPTISINEVDNLSNTEIVEKLFTMYMEHYKDKSIFDGQRIKDYKNIKANEEYAVVDGTAFFVTYSFEQHFWNEYWETCGHLATDGTMKSACYVILVKEQNQFRLDIKGLEPPTRNNNTK